MFLIGIFIHFIFLFSIFDIYFKSPVVKNVTPYQSIHAAPADRLVLFVIDGLRAESFINYTTMPYLRSIANTHGRWGISRTRVPTESRPGHVAIIAGFYEDPSAIAKGWKENPVDFDSVFNQSSNTWCWGTYDIIEIFAKETTSHIFTEKLDPYDQSFSSDKNTTLLDNWVFTKVKEFFQKAKNEKSLYEKLHNKGIVFFLHLLGTDTSGHTHKPKTQNFLTTIRFVDENILEIEKIIRDFYEDDGKTTFLMTSDHGMTNWGSHGTGDDHETQTPYVLWGAGVQQIQGYENQSHPKKVAMSLEHRFDINQADLAPLMSTVLSIPVPTNSIGQLPSGLLNMTLENKAKAIYSNCRQMIAQYNKKRLDVEANAISLFYQPFELFDDNKVKEILRFSELLLENKQYDKLIMLSEEIMNLSLNGLIYYHNYYQTPLLITVTLSFIGWIFCLMKVLLAQKIFTQEYTSIKQTNKSKIIDTTLKAIFGVIYMFLCISIYVQNLPIQYYVYFLMPVFLWFYVLTPIKFWIKIIYMSLNKARTFWFSVEMLCYVLGSICLAVALTHRWVLSIPLIGMGLWPFLSSWRHLVTNSVCVAWTLGCSLLSMFSFMSVIGKEVSIGLVILAGLFWYLVLGYYYWKTPPMYHEMRKDIIILTQAVFLMLVLHVIFIQARRFENGASILQDLQSFSWFTSALLPILPLFCTKKFIDRLLCINTSIIIFYLLLSVSHEGLFMVTLMLSVNCWMFIEFKIIYQDTIKISECCFGTEIYRKSEKGLVSLERSINSNDFRRAFFFTTYIIVAYFGTGNIASLNSFEVRWVLCFTTSFQPFVITTLVLLKTLAPFLSVACSFRAIQQFTKAPLESLGMIVLIFSNIMGLYMLYHVKNTGSWLEIGTSISQFVIVQVITLFIVLINMIAKVLTNTDAYSILKLTKTRKKYI